MYGLSMLWKQQWSLFMNEKLCDNMKKVFLIIDESGAKGYADNKEQYAGEIGVMAGYIFGEEQLDTIQCSLDAIQNNYISDGKMHITNLSPEDQLSLRHEIFNFLLKSKTPCLYEAIHSEGFHKEFQSETYRIAKIKESQKSKIRTSNHAEKWLLHEELFQGIFGKALAWCIDNIGDEFKLAIITDRIDDTLKKRFIIMADEFLNLTKPTFLKTKGYDLDKKEKLTGSITTSIKNADDLLGDLSKATYSINHENSSLTLAADVIANSIYHHFETRPNEDRFKDLHNKEGLSGHKLEGLFYGFSSLGSNDFSDTIFKHPNNRLTPH